MTERDEPGKRVQIQHLELTGKSRDLFLEAMDRYPIFGKPVHLARFMLDEWLKEWERRGKPGMEPVLGPPERGKRKSGEIPRPVKNTR